MIAPSDGVTGSSDPGSGAHASSPTRPRWLQLALGILLVCSGVAGWQAHLAGANPRPATGVLSWRWWLSPISANGMPGRPAIVAHINGVALQPGTGTGDGAEHVWIVGTGGLLAVSEDQGTTWLQSYVPEMGQSRGGANSLSAGDTKLQGDGSDDRIQATPQGSKTLAEAKSGAIVPNAPSGEQVDKLQKPVPGDGRTNPARQSPTPAAGVDGGAVQPDGPSPDKPNSDVPNTPPEGQGGSSPIPAAPAGDPSTTPAASVWSYELLSVAFRVGRPPIGLVSGYGGTVLVTRPGGRAWFRRSIGTSLPVRHVAGSRTLIFDDSGARWVYSETSVGGSRVSTQAKPIAPIRAMALTAIGDLVIDGGGNLSLTHAEGGGSTGLAGKGFQAFDEDHGLKVALAVGDGGAVTWIDLVKPSLDFDFSIEPSFAGRTARAVVLTGVDRALAVGDGGTIVRLHRGKGVNSEGLASGTTADLRGIALSPTNARVAYSVGSHGTVLRSTDAGANWTRMTADWRAAFPALAVEVSKPRVGGVIPSLPTDGIAARRVWMVPAPWYFASLLVVGGLVAIGLAPVVKKEPVAGGIRDSLDTDRPLEPGDRDVVGIGRLALAISRLLRNENTSPPLTLAVTGRWGQGKSSLMNLVRGDLRQFGIRPVWFNAWHHQDEETLLAGLLSSIRTQAVAPLWHVDGVGFRLRLLKQRFRRYLPHALLSLALFAGAVGYLAQTDESLSHSVAAIAGRVKAAMVYVGVVAGEDGSVQAGGAGKTLDLVIGDDESGSGTRVQGSLRDAPTGSPVAPLRATGQFAVVLASLPVLYGLYRSLRAFGADPAKLLAAVSEGAKVADLRQQASFRERFAREFAEVTRALRPRPMLIVIDDLDRCQPKRVVTVLEAVNFLASSGQCFIMLGMDPVIVEHCVALWYKSVSSTLPTPQEHEKGTQGPLSVEEQGRRSREFARRYIQKLIQLRIAVPEVSLDAVAALAADDRSSVPRTADPGPSKRRHWLREVAWAAGSTLMSGAPALAVVAGLVFCGWLGARLYVPPENPETDAQRTVASGAAPFAPGASNGAAPPNSATPGTSAEPPPSGAVGAGAALPQSPAAIIPATSTALLVWLVFAAGFAGTLMLAVREGLLQKAMVEGDSLEFTAATKKWLCVLHREGSTTPRAVRQAINRVRFLAMLQRPPTPTDPGLWARCLLRLGLAAPVSGRVPAPPRPSNTPVIESLVAWTLLQAGLDLPPGSIGHQQACNAAHARSPAAGALVAQEWSGLLDPNQSEYQQLALIVPMR